MDRQFVLNKMKNSIGTQDPVEFFKSFVDVFEILFNKIDLLEKELKLTKVSAALAIDWDSSIASRLIAKQIEVLRQDPQTYHQEISALQTAYNQTFTNSREFVQFWKETLGYHPFMDYE